MDASLRFRPDATLAPGANEKLWAVDVGVWRRDRRATQRAALRRDELDAAHAAASAATALVIDAAHAGSRRRPAASPVAAASIAQQRAAGAAGRGAQRW